VASARPRAGCSCSSWPSACGHGFSAETSARIRREAQPAGPTASANASSSSYAAATLLFGFNLGLRSGTIFGPARPTGADRSSIPIVRCRSGALGSTCIRRSQGHKPTEALLTDLFTICPQTWLAQDESLKDLLPTPFRLLAEAVGLNGALALSASPLRRLNHSAGARSRRGLNRGMASGFAGPVTFEGASQLAISSMAIPRRGATKPNRGSQREGAEGGRRGSHRKLAEGPITVESGPSHTVRAEANRSGSPGVATRRT